MGASIERRYVRDGEGIPDLESILRNDFAQRYLDLRTHCDLIQGLLRFLVGPKLVFEPPSLCHRAAAGDWPPPGPSSTTGVPWPPVWWYRVPRGLAGDRNHRYVRPGTGTGDPRSSDTWRKPWVVRLFSFFVSTELWRTFSSRPSAGSFGLARKGCKGRADLPRARESALQPRLFSDGPKYLDRRPSTSPPTLSSGGAQLHHPSTSSISARSSLHRQCQSHGTFGVGFQVVQRARHQRQSRQGIGLGLREPPERRRQTDESLALCGS